MIWIATFPFTACSTFLLIRHLLKTSPPVTAFTSSMIVFSPFRFWHALQIEALIATGFILFVLYFFHRSLETPSLKNLIGLILSFWIFPANTGPSLFHHNRMVSWLISMPRSCSKFSTFPSDSGKTDMQNHRQTDYF